MVRPEALGLVGAVIAAGMAGKARAGKARMGKAAPASAGTAAKAWVIAMPMTGAAREWVAPVSADVEARAWMIAESAEARDSAGVAPVDQAVRAWGLKGKVVPAEAVAQAWAVQVSAAMEGRAWVTAKSVGAQGSETAARMGAVTPADRAAQASVGKAIRTDRAALVSAGATGLEQVTAASVMARGPAAPRGEVVLAGAAQALTGKVGKMRAAPVQVELTRGKMTDAFALSPSPSPASGRGWP